VSGQARHDANRATGEHGHALHSAAGHAAHGQEHEHLSHVGHAGVYRRRFWITLILAVPVVVYSEMVQDWFGFTAPQFPGDGLVAPLLGTVIFFYGGAVFLTGAWSELRRRAPGMMLLVSLAISVAFLASAASTLGLFDLEFWWELSALVVIMLLGHWQEMKALGQARGALSALAELCRTRPSGCGTGVRSACRSTSSRPETWCSFGREAGSPPTARSSRATRSWTSR
jgi:Cu2+-exporting ATPase